MLKQHHSAPLIGLIRALPGSPRLERSGTNVTVTMSKKHMLEMYQIELRVPQITRKGSESNKDEV